MPAGIQKSPAIPAGDYFLNEFTAGTARGGMTTSRRRFGGASVARPGGRGGRRQLREAGWRAFLAAADRLLSVEGPSKNREPSTNSAENVEGPPKKSPTFHEKGGKRGRSLSKTQDLPQKLRNITLTGMQDGACVINRQSSP